MSSNTIYNIIGLIGIALAILFFILPPDKPKNGGDACGSDHKKAHC